VDLSWPEVALAAVNMLQAVALAYIAVRVHKNGNGH